MPETWMPVCLRLSGKLCKVFGGGQVAERKVMSLVQSGARVQVISPELCDSLKRLASDRIITWHQGKYESGQVQGAFLVIAATDDPEINRQIAEEAHAHNVLANVVDAPGISDFTFPAVSRKGHLCIAVSTDGTSPMLARVIREELDQLFGEEYSQFLELMGNLRGQVLQRVSSPGQRREVFRRMVDSGLIEKLKAGVPSQEVLQQLEKLIADLGDNVGSLS